MSTEEALKEKTAAAEEKKEQEKEDEDEGKQDRVYTKQLRSLAEKGTFEFEFVEGSRAGERIKLPRQKISNRMMRELENDRAEYASIVSKFNAKNVSKEERHEAANMLTDLYAKLAKCYFHIERDDFDNMEWDSTKPNIDAAANVSLRGRPNLV